MIHGIERETERALLISLDGVSVWVPRSQVEIIAAPDGIDVMFCPSWLWHQKVKNAVPARGFHQWYTCVGEALNNWSR
jgi:hypothetical protein